MSECEHGISDEPCPDCIKEYHADRIEQLESLNGELCEALKFLISVKLHKEKHGKDEWYAEAMPKAWRQARDATDKC